MHDFKTPALICSKLLFIISEYFFVQCDTWSSHSTVYFAFLRKQVEMFVFEMWEYDRPLNYLYNVQEFSLYSELWCFVYMFRECNYDFYICSRDIPFCSCDRVSCLVACCGCIPCIAWSTQVMCVWFYSIFIILILFIYPDLYLISDIM